MKDEEDEQIHVLEKLKNRLESKKVELTKKLENNKTLKEYANSEKEIAMGKKNDLEKIDSQINQL